MNAPKIVGAVALGVAVAMGTPLAAQDVDVPAPLEVGDVAPDFSMPGAVRHGVLAEDIKLSDYEGRTVVLAFFFRARTRG